MKYKILIIDDEPDEVENVIDSYRGDDAYEVIHATTGRDGLRLAKEHAPHVIILDIRMQPINGYEVIKRLQIDARTASIPIVIFSITGRDLDEDRKIETIMLGADYYLAKKEDLRELRAVVDRAIQRAHARQVSSLKIQVGEHTLEILDELCRQVDIDGVVKDLTRRESDLLLLLRNHRGEIVSLDEIGTSLYRESWEASSVYRLIDRLRRDIEPNFHDPIFILTVRGQGIQLVAEDLGKRSSSSE